MKIYAKNLPCSEPECDRIVGDKGGRGRCARCNQRLKREHRRANPLPCSLNGCDGLVVNAGTAFCDMHRSRMRRNGDAGLPHRTIGVRGEGYLRRDGYRAIGLGGRQIPEHRLVMEQILGRPLLPHENVHHINGDRADNRPENLEIWTTKQPPGQRVIDKVAWAVELLELYAPDVLANRPTQLRLLGDPSITRPGRSRAIHPGEQIA